MSTKRQFMEFMRRIRAGDNAAATELVERYEPLIRREVRLKIADERLNRAFDSNDVSQAVLASFFTRAAIGQFSLQRPEQLLQLLIVMTRNKLASRVRQERSLCRDMRRVASAAAGDLELLADHRPTPSETLLKQELIDRLRSALSAEERSIAELREQGLAWSEIAQRLGGKSQARRVQFSRGLKRAGQQLRPPD